MYYCFDQVAVIGINIFTESADLLSLYSTNVTLHHYQQVSFTLFPLLDLSNITK